MDSLSGHAETAAIRHADLDLQVGYLTADRIADSGAASRITFTAHRVVVDAIHRR